ncbi:MAG: translocation/assembly module TamB domain-containing protein, partial [Myxococcota bacterium]|nr:translocation/assembly module TamB domain-containing protein [Myxococcota bacterium]
VGLPEEVEGVLGGGLQIGGTAAQPTVAGALQVIEGRVGGVEVSPALIAVSPSETAYKLMGLFGLGEGSLELAGSLDYDFDSGVALEGLLQREGLSIDVWGRGVPLGVLSVVDPAIGKAEGLVTVRGHVGGSLGQPSADLELLLEEGSIEYPPLGVVVENLVLQAETEGDELLIRRASGSTTALQGRSGRRSGSFQAEGSIPFRGEEPSMEVSLDFEEALISNLGDLQLVLSGGLMVTGEWPALVFQGAIGVDESRVVIDEEFWLSQATLSLDPDLNIHREETAVEAEGVAVERAYWEDFVAQLSVDLGNNSWGEARVPLDATYGAVSSALSTVAVQGRVRGTLEVDGTLEDALVKGEIETDRAEAVVFGAEFDVDRGGVVRFTGSDYQNPELDLSATHETNGYGDVTVDISGTVEAMSLQFRSSEGLSEKDIAALLLLGRPTSELGEGEGGLVEAAVGALAGRAESIGLGDWVDLFQLETQGDAISAYTVGKAVGDKAFLSYSWDSTADEDENMMELTLEVFFTRHVQTQVVTGDSGQSSVDVFLRWRF